MEDLCNDDTIAYCRKCNGKCKSLLYCNGEYFTQPAYQTGRHHPLLVRLAQILTEQCRHSTRLERETTWLKYREDCHRILSLFATEYNYTHYARDVDLLSSLTRTYSLDEMVEILSDVYDDDNDDDDEK